MSRNRITKNGRYARTLVPGVKSEAGNEQPGGARITRAVYKKVPADVPRGNRVARRESDRRRARSILRGWRGV